MSPDSLKNSIEGCLRNDNKCQVSIYESYYGYSLKIVFRYIYRYENAVEVTNDGFVKFFNTLNRFRPDDDIPIERLLMGWLRKIMINTALDALRKQQMVPEIGGIPDYLWELKDTRESADHRLLHNELIINIKNLPPGYRVVFNMYVVDGFTHAEIADALGITVGTSKSTLSRARALLQKKITEKEDRVTWNP